MAYLLPLPLNSKVSDTGIIGSYTGNKIPLLRIVLLEAFNKPNTSVILGDFNCYQDASIYFLIFQMVRYRNSILVSAILNRGVRHIVHEIT